MVHEQLKTKKMLLAHFAHGRLSTNILFHTNSTRVL